MNLQRPGQARQRIIVALDVDSADGLKKLLRTLRGRIELFKVGKELFTSLGPWAVEAVRDEGAGVFLDLKYHDIPNTVSGAVKAAARLGVYLLTVHAAGGKSMIEAAARAAQESPNPPAIIGVTVLTSLDAPALSEIGFGAGPEDLVTRLGQLAISSGADGLVASPQEVRSLRTLLGPKPWLITPGVRPAGSTTDDQARVATPREAVSGGADFLVIGRPITRAPDPARAADEIIAGIE